MGTCKKLGGGPRLSSLAPAACGDGSGRSDERVGHGEQSAVLYSGQSRRVFGCIVNLHGGDLIIGKANDDARWADAVVEPPTRPHHILPLPRLLVP
ncbi:unnamed protein product [Tilletia laevis]|uniref:Uncharacterized protein n=1 Tax=Tilletia caries TaxID=13290 RepID=A0A177T2Y8_9BASI|nr:hypothetical protein CF336_g8890 [Tilletia laevis]KAE8182545.1 hypothetical protein CF335_g8598 [Tilletia laevis]KAE8243281.1 hypothetical protein A4X03_0g7809 [Tilletia caries]CAD6962983.1 unnamed protein product [Tilletia laevis]CAD6972567.1 unnamed protein product [Tilletia controversa]